MKKERKKEIKKTVGHMQVIYKQLERTLFQMTKSSLFGQVSFCPGNRIFSFYLPLGMWNILVFPQARMHTIIMI